MADPPTSTTSEPLPVAIIGAGIAGLALAIGLHNNHNNSQEKKKKIPFILYEEASEFSAVGAGIGFGPNGILAMDFLEAGFRAKYERVCVGNLAVEDEDVFFEGLLCEEGLGMNESWYGRSSWGASGYQRKSAHRREVLDILTSFIPRDRVQFNKRLTNIEQREDHVVLSFADGTVAQAALVVGADGIQSIVREHVLRSIDPEGIAPKYANSYAYRAVIPMADAKEILGDRLTDTAKMYLGKDRLVVTYRVSGGAEFNFLHCVCEPNSQWPSSDRVTQKVTSEEMLADFADRGIDSRLLRLLEKAPPTRWGLFHHIETATYYRDRVVLVGDSAHASLPYQAAGAGQGVEDALILTSALGAMDCSKKPLPDQLRKAMRVYDEIRRPRAQRQAEQSLEAGLLLSFQDPRAGSDMEKILLRMQNGRFDWLWFHDLRDDLRRVHELMARD